MIQDNKEFFAQYIEVVENNEKIENKNSQEQNQLSNLISTTVNKMNQKEVDVDKSKNQNQTSKNNEIENINETIS